jgi:uncharacterized SAM-binding protein YcdF (DUF218 family)
MALDALVLLGCRVGPPPLRGAAARRAARAAEAYGAGLAPLVVVSGGRRWGDLVEADALAGALRERGVPESALHLERRSLTTRGNARHSAEVLGKLGAKTVGIVTCDWHLPRALVCFRRAGVGAEPIPAPSPEVFGVRKLKRAVREWGASVIDRVLMLPW